MILGEEYLNPLVGTLTTSGSTNTVAWYTSGVRWKFCASCATKIGDDWKFCAGCGTAVGCISQGITSPYAGPQYQNSYTMWSSPNTYTVTSSIGTDQ